MKNTFSLVSTYMSWSSLSLPTLRMRKTSESCTVSAAHPPVKRHSYRLLRFSSFRYITKGVIFIGRPPLRSDKRYPRGGRSSLRWSSVCAGCINQHQCLYSVTATEQQKRQWLRFSFCCFRNDGQYKAGFASTLTLVNGWVTTIPDPATVPEPQVSVATFWLYLSCLGVWWSQLEIGWLVSSA